MPKGATARSARVVCQRIFGSRCVFKGIRFGLLTAMGIVSLCLSTLPAKPCNARGVDIETTRPQWSTTSTFPSAVPKPSCTVPQNGKNKIHWHNTLALNSKLCIPSCAEVRFGLLKWHRKVWNKITIENQQRSRAPSIMSKGSCSTNPSNRSHSAQQLLVQKARRRRSSLRWSSLSKPTVHPKHPHWQPHF